MKNIFVLCGGKSVEHDISLRSATAVINSIDRKKFNVRAFYISLEGKWIDLGLIDYKINDPDELRRESTISIAGSIRNFLEEVDKQKDIMIFPALHGSYGEDGTIQGMLEMLDLPYVGNGVLSSALAMDKSLARDVFDQAGIPQAKYLNITRYKYDKNQEDFLNQVEEYLGFPVYVKPSNSGSSVGISPASSRDELVESITNAFKYDSKIIVEEEIVGRELQISVIGNHEPKASLPGEFIMEKAFFDYNAKYIDNKIKPVVPANLDEKKTEEVRRLAEDAYKALLCHGLARVDIFVDDQLDFYVNEINTMPGFTSLSMTPVLWKATEDIEYGQLVEILIDYGYDYYKEKKSLVTRRP